MRATDSLFLVGAVPVYQPNSRLTESVRSYASQVDRILIWQNSKLGEGLKDELTRQFGDKIYFLGTGENVGVAEALNSCADEAMRLGAHYLLTMDQDSVFETNAADMLFTASLLEGSRTINSPLHVLQSDVPVKYNQARERWVMTSGNIFSLEAFKEVGPFNSGYFIDGVDMEWCLRARSKGIRIVVHRQSLLNHQLGDTRHHKLFFFKMICSTNHQPFRYYYMYRNYLDIALRQTYLRMEDRISVIKVLLQISISILLFETGKTDKLAHAARGVRDFWRSRMGPA